MPRINLSLQHRQMLEGQGYLEMAVHEIHSLLGTLVRQVTRSAEPAGFGATG
jgi:hypothetical protein